MTRLATLLLPLVAPLVVPALLAPVAAHADHHAGERPNILWITSEDNGPELGCYGDTYADTPNLDALAARSLRYDVCWSNAPVCAPARTTILTGLYPPSFGGEHMRSLVSVPASIKSYPELLAAAGYYCTNPGKTDYNVRVGDDIWQQPAKKSSYRDRAEGQPFFHVVNFTISHESKIRNELGHDLWHNPDEAPVPAYHPDDAIVRRDWAQYYDRITEMDTLVGKELEKLEAAGEADSTIIFYYGDHGSGMPRSKRQPYMSGLQVPLIVHIPEKFAHLRPSDYAAGGRTDRLAGFVDLAPTVLSLAGLDIPETMQGTAFLGPKMADKPYLFGFRGRMDERYDLMRTATDGRYVYLRNYMPQRPYGQFLGYMFETPTTAHWRELFDAGELNEAQSHFWQPKPFEELYDTQSDPDEVINLAGREEHAAKLAELSHALTAWQNEIVDVGMMPEPMMHRRAEAAGLTPYELGRQHREVLQLAVDVASLPAGYGGDSPAAVAASIDFAPLISALEHEDPVLRYWAVQSMMHARRLLADAGAGEDDEAVAEIERLNNLALSDGEPTVQAAAAELALTHATGDLEQARDVLEASMNPQESSAYDVMFVGNVIEQASDTTAFATAADLSDLMQAFIEQPRADDPPGRRPGFKEYVNRIRERFQRRLPGDGRSRPSF